MRVVSNLWRKRNSATLLSIPLIQKCNLRFGVTDYFKFNSKFLSSSTFQKSNSFGQMEEKKIKILVAFDKFKDCLSSEEIGKSVSDTLNQLLPSFLILTFF